MCGKAHNEGPCKVKYHNSWYRVMLADQSAKVMLLWALVVHFGTSGIAGKMYNEGPGGI